MVLSTSRRGRAAAEALTGALAELHVRGGSVDWNALFGPRRPVDLPTYAFQRRRYWMDFLAGTQSADVASAGLTAPGHPLLGALVDHPGTDEVVFTDLWSLRTHDWLADHTVFDSVVVPATAYLDLALSVGEHVGCAAVEELSLEVPLILPETGDVQVRIAVGAADEAGRRSLDVYARPAEDAAALGGWTRHAMGTLAAGAPRPAERADDPRALAAWPPPGAERLDFDGLYDSFAGRRLRLRPHLPRAARGLAAGRGPLRPGHAPERRADGEFALHPALIDTVLHAVVVGDVITVTDDRGLMPFSWSGVHLAGQCGPTVRVRLTPTGEGVVALAVADEHGREIAHVDALTFRPASAEQVRSARGGREQSLYELQWLAAPRASAGNRPRTVGRARRERRPAARLAAAGDGTAVFHAAWTTRSRGHAPRHVVVCLDDRPRRTRPARRRRHRGQRTCWSWSSGSSPRSGSAGSRWWCSPAGASPPAPARTSKACAGASVWGLIRSAQTEHPGRFRLVDIDDERPPGRGFADALALGEDQVALRDGACLVPRMAPAAPADHQLEPPAAGAHRLDIPRRARWRT